GIASQRSRLATQLGGGGKHLIRAASGTVHEVAQPAMLSETSPVRIAALSTVSAILRATKFCWWTASEIAPEIVLTCSIDLAIAALAFCTTLITCPTDIVLCLISVRALVVWTASALTSW